MNKLKQLIIVLIVMFASTQALAIGSTGNWSFAGGFGLTVSPTTLLIAPQLEYKKSSRLYYGPMMQMALGDGGSLFTFSGVIRYVITTHSKIKPSLEGALGLAVADGFGNSVGVHISMGMGFDYILEPGLSLGTMLRMSFAPPVDTFFLSWPILICRVAL